MSRGADFQVTTLRQLALDQKVETMPRLLAHIDYGFLEQVLCDSFGSRSALSCS